MYRFPLWFDIRYFDRKNDLIRVRRNQKTKAISPASLVAILAKMNTPDWIIAELNKSLVKPKKSQANVEKVTVSPDFITTVTMIENFEEITEPLTVDDEKLVPVIITGLKLRSKLNPIKGGDIVVRLNADRLKYGVKSKITEARFRKIINHIRLNGLLAVIATSKGYYTTEDPEEIRSNIRSLEDRANAILGAADGLRKFLPEHKNEIRVTQSVALKLFENEKEP